MLSALLRILGFEAIVRLGARLPAPYNRIASALVLVVANALPIVGVLRGWLGMGDVFLIYWFENLVVWVTSTIKIATARGDDNSAGRARRTASFFAAHYGIFTLVHGVFTGVMVSMVGLKGSMGALLGTAGAIIASHGFSLGFNWFGRNERLIVTPGRAMALPYPRMVALHLAVIGGSFLVLRSYEDLDAADTASQAGSVLLLCAAKLVLDLGFHLFERRPSWASDGARVTTH